MLKPIERATDQFCSRRGVNYFVRKALLRGSPKSYEEPAGFGLGFQMPKNPENPMKIFQRTDSPDFPPGRPEMFCGSGC